MSNHNVEQRSGKSGARSNQRHNTRNGFNPHSADPCERYRKTLSIEMQISFDKLNVFDQLRIARSWQRDTTERSDQ